MRNSKNRKLAKKKADRYFSKYIRQRDADWKGISQCITCNAFKSWKQMDAGHFINRDREATRYDEKNSHAQCKKCNRFQSGNQFEHGQAIDRKYGKGTAKKLLQKSKMRCRRKQKDYEFIAREYKEKIDNLEALPQ